MRYFTCEDLHTVGEWYGCCTSCHEDDNEGYFELMEEERGESILRHCCTSVKDKPDWDKTFKLLNALPIDDDDEDDIIEAHQ